MRECATRERAARAEEDKEQNATWRHGGEIDWSPRFVTIGRTRFPSLLPVRPDRRFLSLSLFRRDAMDLAFTTASQLLASTGSSMTDSTTQTTTPTTTPTKLTPAQRRAELGLLSSSPSSSTQPLPGSSSSSSPSPSSSRHHPVTLVARPRPYDPPTGSSLPPLQLTSSPRLRTSPSFRRTSSPTKGPPPDAETVALTMQRSALQTQVNTAREQLRRERLSERYSDKAQVAKLEALVVKWRDATQLAARELLQRVRAS